MLILVNYLRDQIQLLHSTHHQLFSDRIEWEKVGNGTPQGGGEIVQVYGGFNNIEKSSWSVIIKITDGKILINSIGIGSPLRIGGKLLD